MNSQFSHAVILLAGTGSRLKPLTDTTHKALLPIGSSTFLERMVDQLSQVGIKHFHLALGYRAHDIKSFAQQKFSDFPITFHNNPRYQTTNNAYSLHLVLNVRTEQCSVPTKIDSFLLLDGDLLMSDALINNVIEQAPQKSFVVCDTRKERLNEEAMKCLLNDQQEVILLNKKIPLQQAQGESIGFAGFQKDWLETLKTKLKNTMQDVEKQKNWYYEDVIIDVLATQQAPSPLKCIPTKDEIWTEVDSLQDYEEAKKIFE